MKQSADLKRLLTSIDHKSYPAYKDVRGAYDFNTYILSIDHVQGDPFASPSKVSIQVRHAKAGFPAELFDTPWKKTALEDYLLRCFSREIGRLSFKAKGSGKSGLIATSRPGQEVLSRTACEIGRNEITARFEVGFPAFGRTINSGELIRIFFDFLPGCVENVFFYRRQNTAEIKKRITLADDQQFIRNELKRLDLVSFVADGSILPRETGVSDRPMKGSVAFHSPDSLRITLNLPGHGPISGMAIHRGITLIVGGGYHGKSTLLKALESGVYNHIPGDGREYVITDETAVKLRAEDGRSINHVDISLFIRDLPNKKDTTCFSTADASAAKAAVSSERTGNIIVVLDGHRSVIVGLFNACVAHSAANGVFAVQFNAAVAAYGNSSTICCRGGGAPVDFEILKGDVGILDGDGVLVRFSGDGDVAILVFFIVVFGAVLVRIGDLVLIDFDVAVVDVVVLGKGWHSRRCHNAGNGHSGNAAFDGFL